MENGWSFSSGARFLDFRSGFAGFECYDARLENFHQLHSSLTISDPSQTENGFFKIQNRDRSRMSNESHFAEWQRLSVYLRSNCFWFWTSPLLISSCFHIFDWKWECALWSIHSTSSTSYKRKGLLTMLAFWWTKNKPLLGHKATMCWAWSRIFPYSDTTCYSFLLAGMINLI
jgi:hypothetical protein